ncbi:MAG TPA: hypothetical protein VIR58_01135 [Acidimicrobiales bacterium]
MVDPASPPSPTPRPAKSGSGCLWAVIALPIVLVLGLLAGKALGGDSDDGPDEIRAVLDEGDLDGVAWRVEAVRDVEGDSCAFLFADDEQLTGSCDATPQDASFGESTVVFGLALGTSTEEVHVELSDGSVVDIETMPADGVDGRFYVEVVDGDVDAEALADP